MLTRIINIIISLFMFITSLLGGGINKNDMVKYNLAKTEVTVSVAENPSTGYQWTCNIVNENIASVSDNKYENTAPEGVVGAPGTRYISFKGFQSGTTKIILDYERPWEKDTLPLRTVVLYLTVNEDMTLQLDVFTDTGDLH